MNAWAGDVLTKEELRARTEDFIRSESERKGRIQSELLPDNQSHLYYDGRKVHAGIVIRGSIYPAVIKNGYRTPGCLWNNTVIPGAYSNKEKKVLCQLSDATRGRFTHINQSGFSVGKADLPKKKSAQTDTKRIQSYTQETSRKPQTLRRISKRKEYKNTVVEFNPFHHKQKFGIRAGTWARVLLPRSVSSSEPASIELELLEDVFGMHKTLPAGTFFFTNHRINAANQRLDMELNLMVLPNGEEHRITGTIHSLNRISGLPGAVLTHNKNIADIHARQNILQATKEEIRRTTTQNTITTIAGGVASGVLDANQNAIAPIPDFSVQVPSQEALVRFGRSF